MIGCAGLPREPSALWQATHTWVAISPPRARSGLAATAGACAASAAQAPPAASATASDASQRPPAARKATARAVERVGRRAAKGFMAGDFFRVQNLRILQSGFWTA